MNKKVLIYYENKNIKPIGGPSGYLYNLKKQLEKKGYKNIDFIDCKIKKDEKDEKNINIKKIIPSKILNIIKGIYRPIALKKLLNTTNNIDFEQYEAIHFHNTFHMYAERKRLKTYNGKVLLTSHCPKAPHLEVVEDSIGRWERVLFAKIYKKLKEVDIYSFNRADYIVSPCEEAEEPYYKTWDGYREIKSVNEHKYKYVFTGIQPVNAAISRNNIRKMYNIPDEAFVINYVGRHITTKGFDDLKHIGNELLKKNEQLYFLVAGKEEPIKGLKHKRWIEVGWTSDPYSIISAADVFILPNKQTYFDLVLLEVLSLGKLVIASNTGGNKVFKKLETEGVKIYNSNNEAIKIITELINSSQNSIQNLGNKNKELFNKEFTAEIFCEKYIKLLDSIL